MMTVPDVTQQFAVLDEKEPLEEYNLEHFRTKHLLKDFRRTLINRGIQPGEIAPDFELPQVGGGWLRLNDLRGQPVILHFGSYS
jgi:hypothetical protein